MGRARAIKIHSFIHEKENEKIYGLSDVEKLFKENIHKDNKGNWGRSRGSDLIGNSEKASLTSEMFGRETLDKGKNKDKGSVVRTCLECWRRARRTGREVRGEERVKVCKLSAVTHLECVALCEGFSSHCLLAEEIVTTSGEFS